MYQYYRKSKDVRNPKSSVLHQAISDLDTRNSGLSKVSSSNFKIASDKEFLSHFKESISSLSNQKIYQNVEFYKYSRKDFVFDKDRNLIQPELSPEPYGTYITFDAGCRDWENLCLWELEDKERVSHKTEMDINLDNILILDNLKDFEFLPMRATGSELTPLYPDWAKIAENFDGVLIPKMNFSNEDLENPLLRWYNLPTDSLVVWNMNSVNGASPAKGYVGINNSAAQLSKRINDIIEHDPRCMFPVFPTDNTYKVPEYACSAIGELEGQGHLAFVVGGTVRDCLMGASPKDVDIATSMTPEKVKDIFEEMDDWKVKDDPNNNAMDKKVVTVIYTDENNKSVEVDIATFRYGDPNNPDSVVKDADRRDFTVNGMFASVNPGDGRLTAVFDFHKGVTDISNKDLKFIGDASMRIDEDPLRMVRAVRFLSKGFTLEKESFDSIRSNVGKINNESVEREQVSRERIGGELQKMFSGSFTSNSVEALNSTGLSREIVDRISKDAEIEIVHRSDNMDDILEATQNADRQDSRWEVKASIWIGSALESGEASATNEICKYFAWDKNSRKTIDALVEVQGMSMQNDVDARRIVEAASKYGATEEVSQLISVKKGEGSKFLDLFKDASQDSSWQKLSVNGGVIKQELGVSGPCIGNTLKNLKEQVIQNPSLNNSDLLLDSARQLNHEGCSKRNCEL